jgi:peroxiredoxin (alkyl hydroperoxide reductase subunit C)
MITVGQQLPNATINEYLEVATEGCAIGPNAFEVDKLTAGKKIVIFGLPGAFTPTVQQNTFLVMWLTQLS